MNTENNNLLICIAAHFVPDRVDFLKQVIQNILLTYKCPFHIIIHTNILSETDEPELKKHVSETDQITIIGCDQSKFHHAHDLTQVHRKTFLEKLNDYDVFMYLEDDMLVPYETYLNYLSNFYLLWPTYCPGAIRIETNSQGERFILDISAPEDPSKIKHGNKLFHKMSNPYHAFWLMPRKELRESLKDDFARPTTFAYREISASYLYMELKKPCLIEIYEKNKQFFISETCYSYHVSNNYIKKGSHESTLKVENILR